MSKKTENKSKCNNDCDNVDLNHVKNCGCLDGEECTCGDHCDCGEENDCGCHDENCNCGCEDHKLDINQVLQKYEETFIQLENALIEADKKAVDNERLAITYKKDLERFKERTKEQEEIMKVKAIENVADKLIPILDNFEQALKVSGDPNVLKGFSMIEGMLKNAVKSLGIEEIEAIDKEFDPNLHNAVSKIKTKDKKKNNTIASVYQKGYKMSGDNGKVIRHSMVEIYLQD